MPATADIKVNIDKEMTLDTVENGTVEGFFTVKTAEGEVGTSSFNVPNYGKVKINNVESDRAESKPEVAKNENANGIYVSLDKEEPGNKVSFDVTYKDGKKINKTVSTTITVVDVEDV